MRNIKIGVAGLASLLFGACVVDDPSGDAGGEPGVSETSQGVRVENGISLNGISLNGISLNGISLNGISLNGISLNGISLNGISLNGISLNGISLDGTSLGEVVGSTWTGSLSGGGSLRLRIDTAQQGAGANRDVGMYGISFESDVGWSPLCGLGADGLPVLAIIVPGTWSATAAYSPSDTLQTVACRGKTVAKCVELGYKPWTGRVSQLASCTRMLRGDYCGTGVPYTVDGQRVNIYDNVGIQLDAASWMLEAEWTPAGARCISKTRETRFTETGQSPSCLGITLRSKIDCGYGFAKGAVLISEISGESTTGFLGGLIGDLL